MKKKSGLLALLLLAMPSLFAQTIITQWDFESSITSPSTGTGTNALVGSMTGPASGTGSTTGCVQQTGTGAWQIGTANPGVAEETSGVEFRASTVGFTNIIFEYDQRTSNTGTRTSRIQYTLDGSNWINLTLTPSNYTSGCAGRGAIDNGRIDVGDPVGTNVSDGWGRRTINFSAISGANNNPNFGVRILAAYYDVTGQFRQANAVGTVATAGTWRFDNVSFKGTLPPANIGFASTHQTVNENVGSVNINLSISNSNIAPSSVDVIALGISNATAGTDYVISNATVTFPPSSTGTLPLNITINNDAVSEQTEYIVLQLSNPVNATITGTTRYYLYIKDNDRVVPAFTNELSLQLLSSYQNGSEGTNSAEIVAHDVASQRLFVANSIGNKLDILNFSNPSAITSIASVPLSTYGSINSVDVRNGIVACAMENNTNPQAQGKVVFFDINGVYQNEVAVGAMPDMITFNHAGNKLLVACEGEPNATYTNDPEGEVCIIDISGGIPALTQANVTFVTFAQFNGQENALRAQGIRIFGPGASAAKDFEPEYITVSDDDNTAWVSLQENNALAVINLTTNQVTQLLPLGFKNHNAFGNGFDISDQTNAINIANFPVKGIYMPDAITHIDIGGTTYILTANEGDSREYAGYSEITRLSNAGYVLDPGVFPNAAAMKANVFMGRLNVLNSLGDTDNDGDFDEIYCMGARSLSIWNATTGNLVYDSGDDFEQITANHPVFSQLFNASNTAGAAVAKNRSDDKGPEPEGVVVAEINGNKYAFVSQERIGGAMIYNINNPNAPYFVSYANNRSFATNGPDRGAEGMIFIPALNSPNGNDLIILANEISSSLTIYQVNSCQQISGVALTPSASTGICQGAQITISSPANPSLNYQWYNNGVAISGENSNNLTVNAAGNYVLHFDNVSSSCSGNTAPVQISVNPLPAVSASATLDTLCAGGQTTLSGSGAQNYSWSNGVTDGNPFTPSATQTYTVTGTDANNCSNTATITITVHALPNVGTVVSQDTVCAGQQVALNGTGALNYVWNNGVSNGIPFTPTSTQNYTVTGTDANGCSDSSVVFIVVNNLPAVTATATQTVVCAGGQTTLNGNGAQAYTWTGGVINNTAFAPTSTQTYTVTGTDANNCSNTAAITITVNPLPNVTANATQTLVCSGQQIVLSGSGAQSYTWTGGVTNNVSFIPSATQTYTVTGTNASNCSNTATITVTVNPTPTVTVVNNSNVLSTTNTYVSYQWYFNGSPISGATSQSYTATQNGNYFVAVTDVNGCSNTSTITNVNSVGINEYGKFIVEVYPNPVSNELTINAGGKEIKSIVLFNALGAEVKNETISSTSTTSDLRMLEPGMYFLKLNLEGESQVIRIIKQ